MIRWSHCIKINAIHDSHSYILGGDDDYTAELQVSPGQLYSIELYIIRPISEYTQLTKLFTLKYNCLNLYYSLISFYFAHNNRSGPL